MASPVSGSSCSASIGVPRHHGVGVHLGRHRHRAPRAERHLHPAVGRPQLALALAPDHRRRLAGRGGAADGGLRALGRRADGELARSHLVRRVADQIEIDLRRQVARLDPRPPRNRRRGRPCGSSPPGRRGRAPGADGPFERAHQADDETRRDPAGRWRPGRGVPLPVATAAGSRRARSPARVRPTVVAQTVQVLSWKALFLHAVSAESSTSSGLNAVTPGIRSSSRKPYRAPMAKRHA